MVKRRLGCPIFPLPGCQRQPRLFGLFRCGAAAIDSVPDFWLGDAAPVQVPGCGSLYPAELAAPALEQFHALTELRSYLSKAPFRLPLVVRTCRVGDSAIG